jgi:hypothetical protein
VEALNAAFEGLGLAFRLDAVVAAPASDGAVLECAARWEQLAGQLLPEAAPHSGNATSADPQAVHVVVCEPEGAHGAARVLGDGGDGGGAAAGAVLLRRSALWQSRTSLVHQVRLLPPPQRAQPPQHSQRFQPASLLPLPAAGAGQRSQAVWGLPRAVLR